MAAVEQFDVYELEKQVENYLRSHNAEKISELLDEAQLNDIISLIERTSLKRGAVIFRLLPPERAGLVFDALDPYHQAAMVHALGSDGVGSFFEELGAEDRAMLIDELPPEVAARLMRELDESDQEYTNVVLGYERGTVGRAMSPEIAEIYMDMTAREVCDLLREQHEDLETLYTLPVICLLYTSPSPRDRG